MCRFSKEKKAVLAAAAGVFFLWTVAVGCYASDISQTFSGICDEDEYVLLLQKNNHLEIFDCRGNYMGNCRAVMDDFQWAITVGKDELICYSDGEKWNVYSMEKLENVLEFPEE